MNKMLNALKEEDNFTLTENGAVTHKTTSSKLYDMFALGGAYRDRSDEDVILLFKNAYKEDPLYALKCLFYLRDVRGGQGERRFFKVCMKWFADKHTKEARLNMARIPEYGRWDDLFCFFGTKLENDMLNLIKAQLTLDMDCKTPSLLAKWMPSVNTSSKDTVILAKKFISFLGLTDKQYRQMLSKLRTEINVLEKLMSAGKWDEIEFDKIPSKAGLIYKNAFARHDVERAKSEKQSYADFVKDDTKTVNAKALYPYEVVNEACKFFGGQWYCRDLSIPLNDTNRLAVNKYWDNLADYFNNASFNGLAVVDTSGSMTGRTASAPINVAISLGLYCAEKANGPFKNHYISFSCRPKLIETEGVDFVDKVYRIYKTNLCENTDIEATFDLILNTARMNKLSQDDLPKNMIVISDMEFDSATTHGYGYKPTTLMEGIKNKWEASGYEMPNLVFWNVSARQNNIPMRAENGITFVSGFSPVTFEMIMTGKTSYDLMYDKLNSDRYSNIEI